MKKRIIRAVAGVAVAVAVVGGVMLARASTFTLVGSMATVNNTTSNTAAIAMGTLNYPGGTFYIQNAGLTATGALVINIQASLDNTNFLTIATYHPAATNATTELFSPSYSVQTIYMRAQVITTNSVSVGGIYQN